MYKIGVKKRFSAAHRLLEYDGNCERLHGHNWTVEVIFSGKRTDNLGMLIDFRILKKVLGEILDEFDHQFLNELKPFKKINPSSEYIARHIYRELSGRLKTPAKISEVRVWESEDSWAAYLE
jgi:6-pyruvoyltetrahydropterin/6-carboxytetrahydropterin synthase